jgi:glycosyltransferase involved in cell wall biosynthesis
MHEFAMRRAVHPLDAVDAVRLVRLIKSLGRFDVIHGHSSKGGALARLAGRWLRTPVVYTPHALVTLDPALSRMARMFYGRIERWLSRSTAAIIAVSRDELAHIADEKLRPALARLVPNAIDPPPFPTRDAARARVDLAPEHVAIGFVGRLSRQKAPDVMLEAFAKVAQRNENARLIMVGSGPLDDDVRAAVSRLGLEAKVRLLGDVVATNVMPAFDLFCLSSRYEGLPYVLLESLAAGLPIVATRVGGVSTTVEDGVNGLITAPDDVAELSAALSRVVDDAPLRSRFAAASAERAREHSLRDMVQETIAVYEEAIASRVRQ